MLVDALLECDASGSFHLAPGAAERGYVGFHTASDDARYHHLFTIEPPSTLQIDSAWVYANEPVVFSDPVGTPYLAARVVPDLGIGFYRRTANNWTLELVSAPSTLGEFYHLGGARFASDGRAFVAYSSGMSMHLSTRDVAGVWRRIDVGRGSSPSLVVDSKQRPHVIYSAGTADDPRTSILDWREGAPIRLLWSDVLGVHSSEFATAPLDDGGVVSTLRARDGIHVLIAAGDRPAAIDVLVPGSDWQVAGCPDRLACPMMPGSTCTQKGHGGAGQQVVATTNDGTLWLAHGVTYIDQDLRSTGGPATNCGQKLHSIDRLGNCCSPPSRWTVAQRHVSVGAPQWRPT